MSKLITNTIRHTGGSADNITLTSGGHVLLGDGGNDNAFFKAHAADGEASDLYVGQFINAEATAGVNYGVNIQGGSNSTDHGLRVKNHAGTAQLLVRGDGEVQIGSGDLVFGTAGKGICLGVTSNTDSNTLDDYEEGTFTPSWVGADTAGSTTYSTNLGSYTKIGNLVNCRGYTTVTGMTGSGSISISNLPFTSTSSDTGLTTGSCMVSMLDLHSDAKWVVPYKNAGTSILYLFQSGDSWSWSGAPVDTSWTIAWGITYQAA